jgi:hypothetical protein
MVRGEGCLEGFGVAKGIMVRFGGCPFVVKGWLVDGWLGEESITMSEA